MVTVAESLLLTVLQGKLFIDDNNVRLIQYPLDKNLMPCLTVDTSVGDSIIWRNKYNVPIVEKDTRGHIINKKMQEAIVTQYETLVRLSIWCLKEKTRHNLIMQVEECFNKALADNYQYCTSYMNDTCPVKCLTEQEWYQLDKRAIKGQCPKPYDLPYENVWTRYNIELSSFNMSKAYSIDELTETKPLLRSIFDIRFVYTTEYIIGGKISEHIKNETRVGGYDSYDKKE